MYVVIYKFSVLEGSESNFRVAWRKATDLIYKKLGSLGSRLHLSDKNEWIAYAMWPSKELYEQSWDFSAEEKKIITEFRKYCNHEVLYKLSTVDNRVKPSAIKSPSDS